MVHTKINSNIESKIDLKKMLCCVFFLSFWRQL